MPPYLELFCTAAAGSATLVDFLIFHNGALDAIDPSVCPFNVKLISLGSMEEFSNLVLRVLDQKEDAELTLNRSQLSTILARHMLRYPYVLVEFKPALGHIFAEYIEQYSHWGYSDLDIIFGDLPRWISKDEINDFDIVTYGFGDQHRLYLRGQFTFHKNVERINQLWRGCEYLAHMDERFAKILQKKEQFRFESAEGCYSSVILEQTDIKVKYAVKAFTDVKEHDTIYTHGLHVAIGNNHDRTVVFKAGSVESGRELSRLPPAWFESAHVGYSSWNKPLQSEIGMKETVELVESNKHCMYWAQQEYQRFLCNDNLENSDTVFWIDGELFKQKYEKMRLPSNVVSSPFFHFQEWKRFYRRSQLVSFQRSGASKLFVVGKDGVIPVFDGEERRNKKDFPSPLGVNPRKWKASNEEDRDQFPIHTYCLRSGPREFPKTPPAPQCQWLTSWRDSDAVQIISSAPGWSQVDPNVDVTMALTLQITADQASDPAAVREMLTLIALYLDNWQGQPSVLVVHVAGATSEVEALLQDRLEPSSNLSFGLESCLVGVIFSEDRANVSRKALLNMASDAAPSRWVISGFEIERGLVISKDAAFFAHRASRTHLDFPGSIFIVPQFGFIEKDIPLTLTSLFAAKGTNGLERLADSDKEDCRGRTNQNEQHGVLSGDVLVLWWMLSEGFVTGDTSGLTDDTLALRVKALEDIQLALTELLTDDKHFNLFAMDVSPIVMTDHLGPREGMVTSHLAREVEEFAGKQCYNGLRLAQLATLGYRMSVLSGAFAASTDATRRKATSGKDASSPELGSSRCDGCFLFDEEHEDILENIALDERHRPAKAAILWDRSLHEMSLEGHT